MTTEIKIYHLRDNKAFYGGEEFSGLVEGRGPLKVPNASIEIRFSDSSQTVQGMGNRN
jgi:hypothetical protein